MIGKGKSIKHTSIAVDYARLKQHGEEIGRNHLAGETGPEVANEFRMCQNLNGRCENNTMQFILSPSIEDGKSLTNAELRDIYNDFTKRMNLEDRQSIAFVHRDKAHTHIHIYANRIGFDGQAYKDNFLSNRTSQVAEEIALQRNFTLARDVQAIKMESQKDIIAEIKHRHKITMQHKPTDLKDYINLMKASKVNVEVVQSKTGKVSGLRMEFQGQTFKASQIDRKLSFNNLTKQLGTSLAENANIGLKVAKTITKGISKGLDAGMGM